MNFIRRWYWLIAILLLVALLVANQISKNGCPTTQSIAYGRPEEYYSGRMDEQTFVVAGETGVYACSVNQKGRVDCAYFVQQDDGWHLLHRLEPKGFISDKIAGSHVAVGMYYGLSSEDKELVLITLGVWNDEQSLSVAPRIIDTAGTPYQCIFEYHTVISSSYQFVGAADIDENEFSISIIEDDEALENTAPATSTSSLPGPCTPACGSAGMCCMGTSGRRSCAGT